MTVRLLEENLSVESVSKDCWIDAQGKRRLLIVDGQSLTVDESLASELVGLDVDDSGDIGVANPLG